MNFVYPLLALWQLTDRQQRVLAISLVFLLIIASAFEMGGMLVLFSFITGLSDAAAGSRAHALRGAVEWATGRLSNVEFAIYGGVVVVGVFAVKNLLAVGVDFLSNRFLMKIYERAAPQLLQAFLSQPYELILSRGHAEPIRILSQMLRVFNESIGSAIHVLSDTLLVVVIAALLFIFDPVLAILGAAMFSLALAALHYVNRNLLVRMGSQSVDMQRDSNKVLNESFSGIINIRLSNSVAMFVNAYRRFIQQAALLNRRRRALSQLPRITNEVLLAAGIVAAVLYFTLRGSGIEAVVPTLAIFGFAGLRLTGALSRMSLSLQRISESRAEFHLAIDEIRTKAPSLLHPAIRASSAHRRSGDAAIDSRVPAHFAGALEARSVAFTYPGGARPAVDGVDLIVRPGSFTAICGASGSGKSTLLLIMMGLIRPQRGSILCDGANIFDRIDSWQSRIAFVGQPPFIATRTIRENVAFGLPPTTVDDAKVWQALELAQLADEIRELSDGLDTVVGERGPLRSGGQRQRLDIARALYDSRDVLFLDEATAALDNPSEARVMEAVRDLRGRMTIVCVAHRLSTIRDADVIYVMQDGRTISSGTYEQLVACCASFREMAREEKDGPH